MAVTALVCGIGALVVPWAGFLLSVLAIVFGSVGISQTGKNPELGGRGMAIAGLVCGIVALVVWIPIIAFWSSLWFWAI
ncbi:MAG: DUF4190 domain-containing protein [Chloroflexota bacterium]|nr:DUF4190 domain-containing protein [Chloroflexota bacterium]